MNRIEERFAALKAEGQTAFIPYITGGDPTIAISKEIILALADAGSDVIELGIPFSDPVGDGPVIQHASQRALLNHVTTRDILDLVREVRKESQVSILLFSYFNPILVYGIERLAKDMAEAGADGLLCVDLPAEEAAEYKQILDAHGLCTVFLTAPTTSDLRLEEVARQCTGFVYYVSRLGVTGERAAMVTDLAEQVARIKRQTGKPVAVGFGISTPEHAKHVAGMAEGVVVGSAIVRLIGEKAGAADTAAAVHAFVEPLVKATKGR
jgi:tryptophan synthase alpha chain